MSRTIKTASKKKNQAAVEVYDVIIPIECVMRIRVSTNFPNRRSKVQVRAKEEVQRLLGKELTLSDKISFGRAHSRKVEEV